jgi:acetyl esterase
VSVNVLPALRVLLGADGVSPISDVPSARASRRKLAELRGGRLVPVQSVVEVAGMRLYEPIEKTSAGALVVVHGGGWVWGGLDEVDPLARALAEATGRLTASVAYRLAPEHRYPAAHDDVAAHVHWLITDGHQFDRADVIAVGLSAGGNMVASLSARLRAARTPLSGQVLVHPMLDPSVSSPSALEFASLAPLSRSRALWFWEKYGPAPSDPRAVPPLEPALAGLPPTYLVLAEVDVLRDEGLAYADQLRSAGVAVKSSTWPGTVHGFLTMAGLIPEVHAASLKEIAAWIATRAEG